MPKTAAAPPPRFAGFADRGARFFRALAKHQNRDWFQAHRRDYDEGWHAPMKALLAEVRDRIDGFFPHHPRGVDPDHPRADLLKRKGLIVSFPPLPKTLLVSRKLVDWLATHSKRVVPLVEWLATVVE